MWSLRSSVITMRREQRADGTYRIVVKDWGLRRGCVEVSTAALLALHHETLVVTQYNGGPTPVRVTIAGRAFSVLEEDWRRHRFILYAQDSPWCLVWGAYRAVRFVNHVALNTAAGFLMGLGRWRSDGDVLTWGKVLRSLGRN